MEFDKKNKNWKVESIKIIIMEMLRKKGFSKFEKQSVSVLTDLFNELIRSILLKTKNVSKYRKRDTSTFTDLLSALRLVNIKLSNIEDIIEDKKSDIKNISFNNVSNNIIKEFTKEESYSVKKNINELDLKNNHKYITPECKFQNGFIPPYKDRENTFFISLPPLITTQDTNETQEYKFNEGDIKNFKVEERRVFEEENCKINPKNDWIKINKKDSEINKEEDTKIKIMKLPKINNNIFSIPPKELNDIDIYEISNNKSFN